MFISLQTTPPPPKYLQTPTQADSGIFPRWQTTSSCTAQCIESGEDGKNSSSQKQAWLSFLEGKQSNSTVLGSPNLDAYPHGALSEKAFPWTLAYIGVLTLERVVQRQKRAGHEAVLCAKTNTCIPRESRRKHDPDRRTSRHMVCGLKSGFILGLKGCRYHSQMRIEANIWEGVWKENPEPWLLRV